jgi:hypothetical protein
MYHVKNYLFDSMCVFCASSFFHHGGIVSALLVLKGFYQNEESDACDKLAA